MLSSLTASFVQHCFHFLLEVFANPYKVEIFSCPGTDFTPRERICLGKGTELAVLID